MSTFSLPIFANEVSALLRGKYSRKENATALWPALFDNAFNDVSARFADHWSSEDLYELKKEVGRLLAKRPRKKRESTRTGIGAASTAAKHAFSISREPGNRLVVTENSEYGYEITFLAAGGEVVWLAIKNDPSHDTIEAASLFARAYLANEREAHTVPPEPKKTAEIERIRHRQTNGEGATTELEYVAMVLRESGLDESWLVKVTQGKRGKVRMIVVDQDRYPVKQKDLPATLLAKVRGAARAVFAGEGTASLPGM